MAPNQSSLRDLSPAERRQIQNRWKADVLYPPPVAFHVVKKPRNNQGKGGTDEEKDRSQQVKFNIRLTNGGDKDGDSDKEEQKCARYIDVFDTGTPEEWCNHCETLERLNRQMNYTDAHRRRAVYQTTFAQPALGWFDHAWASREEAVASGKKKQTGDKSITPAEYDLILAQALNDVGLKLMPGDPNQAVRLQKKYLRQNLFMDKDGSAGVPRTVGENQRLHQVLAPAKDPKAHRQAQAST